MSLVPDGIEPVIAWRQWSLPELDQLAAIANPYQWPRKAAPRAVCAAGHNVYTGSLMTYGGKSHGLTPDEHCMCGYWALKQMPEQSYAVVGTVKLWGRVVEGADGYKAQYAYPDQLYLIDQPHWEKEPLWHRTGRARILGDAYGVQCTLISLEAYQQMRSLETGEQPADPVEAARASNISMFTTNTTATTANTNASSLAPSVKITGNTMNPSDFAKHYFQESEESIDEEPEPHDPLRGRRHLLYAVTSANLAACALNLFLATTH